MRVCGRCGRFMQEAWLGQAVAAYRCACGFRSTEDLFPILWPIVRMSAAALREQYKSSREPFVEVV